MQVSLTQKGKPTMTIKELRQQTRLSQSAFAKYFEIPLRTVQDWEQGKRKPPEYLVKLMQFKLEKENGTSCKWRTVDNKYFHTDCHRLLSIRSANMYGITNYCPYCGKKIEMEKEQVKNEAMQRL